MKTYYFSFLMLLGFTALVWSTGYEPRRDGHSALASTTGLPIADYKGEDFSSVQDIEVQNAQCTNPEHVRKDNLDSFFKKYSQGLDLDAGDSWQEVNGVRFKNEHPALVLSFMKLTTKEVNRRDKNPPPPKKFSVSVGCTKVKCAVEEIFGGEVGPWLLLLMTEYNLNLSQYAWDKASPFQMSEIKDVLATIEFTPSHLLPFEQNTPVKGLKEYYVIEKDGSATQTVANSVITLYAPWYESTHLFRQYSLFHEFAHNWASEYAYHHLDISKNWLSLSNWKSDGSSSIIANQKWTFSGSAFISKYAETNPAEDFAESVSAYRFSPSKLKKYAPQKYAYIKNYVFLGHEFLPEANCAQQNLAQDFLKILEKYDVSSSSDANEIDKLVTLCSDKILTFYVDENRHSLSDCIDRQSAVLAMQKAQITKDAYLPRGIYDISTDSVVYHFSNMQKKVLQYMRQSLVKSYQTENYLLHIKTATNEFQDLAMCDHMLLPLNALDDYKNRIKQSAAALNNDNVLFYGMSPGIGVQICMSLVELKANKSEINEDDLAQVIGNLF